MFFRRSVQVFVLCNLCICFFTSVHNSFASTPAEWTVMVYLNADNNLEPFGLRDFLEMASVDDSSQINVVVQFDRHPGYSPDFDDWSGTLRFHVKKGMKPLPDQAIEDLGEVDMGEGASVVDFVDWGMQKFPAKRYMLVIWDHGQGWRFKSAVTPIRDISRSAFTEMKNSIPGLKDVKPLIPAFSVSPGPVRYSSSDESSSSKLYNRDLQDALEGYLGAKRLDVIGFDACLMAMVETAFALRKVGHVLVASEELEPGDGWDYSRWLGELVKNPTADAKGLGKIVVQAYRDAYKTSFEVTLSAIDLEKTDQVAGKISLLADACRLKLSTELANIKAARGACSNYAPGYGLHGIDLAQFCKELESRTTTSTIKNLASDLRADVSAQVIDAFASSDRQGTFGSYGLAIYFPHRKAAYNSDPDKIGYTESNLIYPVQFVQQHKWDNFLQEYFVVVP
jgi:hypothetical protein